MTSETTGFVQHVKARFDNEPPVLAPMVLPGCMAAPPYIRDNPMVVYHPRCDYPYRGYTTLYDAPPLIGSLPSGCTVLRLDKSFIGISKGKKP